jgi:hypothetical protein
MASLSTTPSSPPIDDPRRTSTPSKFASFGPSKGGGQTGNLLPAKENHVNFQTPSKKRSSSSPNGQQPSPEERQGERKKRSKSVFLQNNAAPNSPSTSVCDSVTAAAANSASSSSSGVVLAKKDDVTNLTGKDLSSVPTFQLQQPIKQTISSDLGKNDVFLRARKRLLLSNSANAEDSADFNIYDQQELEESINKISIPYHQDQRQRKGPRKKPYGGYFVISVDGVVVLRLPKASYCTLELIQTILPQYKHIGTLYYTLKRHANRNLLLHGAMTVELHEDDFIFTTQVGWVGDAVAAKSLVMEQLAHARQLVESSHWTPLPNHIDLSNETTYSSDLYPSFPSSPHDLGGKRPSFVARANNVIAVAQTINQADGNTHASKDTVAVMLAAALADDEHSAAAVVSLNVDKMSSAAKLDFTTKSGKKKKKNISGRTTFWIGDLSFKYYVYPKTEENRVAEDMELLRLVVPALLPDDDVTAELIVNISK